jgi:hypothetical protein
MRNIALTALIAALLLFEAQSSRGALDGEVENIVFKAETDEGAGLAEKEANLIIAHGLGKYFKHVFVIENKGDENLSPIMILKLNSDGHSLQLEKNEQVNEMLDEATYLMANLFKDQKVEIWIQNSNYDNLLKAVYDPGDKKVDKKLLRSMTASTQDTEQQAPEAGAVPSADQQKAIAEKTLEIDVDLSTDSEPAPTVPDAFSGEKTQEAG